MDSDLKIKELESDQLDQSTDQEKDFLTKRVPLASTLFMLSDFVGGAFIGGYVLNNEGRPLIRMTEEGESYFVREPSLVRELLGTVYGGTVVRDKNGIPITDSEGRVLREPGFFDKGKTKENI